MDPAISIPLHFSIEFIGVTVLSGSLAWAVDRRQRLLAVGFGLVLVAQVIHAGQFVSGESAALVLGARMAGLLLAAVAVHSNRGETSALSAAGATRSVPALGFGTAFASAGLAAAFKRLPDPILWLMGWGLYAASELWFATITGADGLLGNDLGPHLVRVVGFGVLGAWMWRRTASSLRLRVIAAFGVVLFVVVTIAAVAVSSVVTNNRRDLELTGLATDARAQLQIIEDSNSDLIGRTPEVAQAVAPSLSTPPGGRAAAVNSAITGLNSVLGVDIVAVFGPDGVPLASSGAQPQEDAALSKSEAVRTALTSPPVAVPTAQTTLDSVLVGAVAPVYRLGQKQEPANLFGVIYLGRRIATEQLNRVADRTQLTTAIYGPDRNRIASSSPNLAGSSLSQDALAFLTSQPKVPWTGTIDGADQKFLASGVPLSAGAAPPVAFLVVASDEAQLVAPTLDVARALFAAVLAAVLLSVIIAMWLGSRISRPVEALTETARRVEGGDLDAGSDIDTPDEIGALARAFTSMTSSLRSTLASEREALRQTEAIVSGMGEGLVAMDAHFTVVRFNAAAERITGLDAEAAIGRKCFEVYGESTSASDGKPICDSICPLRHDGGTDGNVNLDKRHLAVTCSPLVDDDGQIIGGVDLLRDITVERQAELVRTSILRNIGHEIKTPLTTILGFSRLLGRKQLSAEQMAEPIDSITRSAHRLNDTVTKLLDVSEMIGGRVRIHPAAVEASKLVRDAAERWTSIDSHIIKTQSASKLPKVLADEGWIARALDQLIGNAIKFSPAGSDILVKAARTSEGVVLSVRDRGIGFDASELASLTEAFVQADASDSRASEGLGVGLTIVESVLDGHGTTLEVVSAVGKGSTFSFVLPTA